MKTREKASWDHGNKENNWFGNKKHKETNDDI
jgi:hypothetical protein